MPIINYNNPHDTEWMKTANKIGSILFHLSGELNVIDYYMVASGNQSEQRR
jgi:hypothetical protein